MISHWLMHRVDIDQTEVRFPELPMSDSLRSWLATDAETSVYQFVVRAMPSTSANQLTLLRKEAADLRKKAADASELREVTTQQAKLIAGLRERVQALSVQERETYELLLDSKRQLLINEQALARLEGETARENARVIAGLRRKSPSSTATSPGFRRRRLFGQLGSSGRRRTRSRGQFALGDEQLRRARPGSDRRPTVLRDHSGLQQVGSHTAVCGHPVGRAPGGDRPRDHRRR